MTPEQLAEEMQREVEQSANTMLVLEEVAAGASYSDTSVEAFRAGVMAGYAATLGMLVRRGILPTADTPPG